MPDYNKNWIQTFTGRKFFPLEPNIDEIDIRDIAHALSMLCRYVGHVSKFYSVAEHSVRISRKLEERGYGLDIQRWGLLHDASEAYLGDVSRPVKHQKAMSGYRDAEEILQALIARKFELSNSEPFVVRSIDTEILGTEAYFLKTPIHPDWFTQVNLAPPWKLTWMDNLGWSPARAEESFLTRFRFLFRFQSMDSGL